MVDLLLCVAVDDERHRTSTIHGIHGADDPHARQRLERRQGVLREGVLVRGHEKVDAGFKKVTERCEFYRRQANAHAWSSAIVTAASLAISFNTPSAKLFEFKPIRNPMQHDLVTKPFEQKDGWVYPPTGPGLGIEVIEEVIGGYRSEKVLGTL